MWHIKKCSKQRKQQKVCKHKKHCETRNCDAEKKFAENINSSHVLAKNKKSLLSWVNQHSENALETLKASKCQSAKITKITAMLKAFKPLNKT